MTEKLLYLGILLALFALACGQTAHTTVTTQPTPLQKIKSVASEHFTTQYELLYSKDSSNVCIYTIRKPTSSSIFTTNKILLFNISKDKAIFEDQKTRVSKMTWISNDQFKITTVAGMIQENESGTTNHIYNMTSGEQSVKSGK